MAEGVKIEIRDTGLAEIGGSVVYSTAADWTNLNARTMRPEFDVLNSNHSGKRIDGDLLRPVNNSVESVNSTRITVTGIIRTEEDAIAFQNILAMSRTQGLKQLRGGLGTLALMPGSQTDDTVYCIIRAIKPVENIGDSINTFGYTIQLEVQE